MEDDTKFPDLTLWPANVRFKLLNSLVKNVYTEIHHLEKLYPIWPSLVEDPVIWRNLCFRRYRYVSVYFQPIEIISDRYQLKNIGEKRRDQQVKIQSRAGDPDKMNVFLNYRQLFHDLDEITKQVNALNMRGAFKLFRERISCDKLEMLHFLLSTQRIALRTYHYLVHQILPTVDDLIFNLIRHDPRFPFIDPFVNSSFDRHCQMIINRLYYRYLKRFYFQGTMRHLKTTFERHQYCQALEKINIYFEEVYDQLKNSRSGSLIRIGEETFNLSV